MNISKTALKLDKFKNLMAYTMATAIITSPSLAALYIFEGTDLLTDNNGAKALVFVGSMLLQVASIMLTIYQSAEEVKPRFLTSPAFWKGGFDLPFKKLFKQKNEKLLLALRSLEGKEVGAWAEKQKATLARLYIQTKLEFPDFIRWQHIVKKTDDLIAFEDFDNYTKQGVISQKLNTLFETHSPAAKELNAVAKQKFLNETLKNTSVSLRLSDWGKIYNNKKNGQKFQYTYQERTKFMLGFGYQLREKDYADIAHLFKQENSKALSNIFFILTITNYPNAVDWNIIKPMFDKYKNEDSFYTEYAPRCLSLAEKDTQNNVQKEIIQDIDSQITEGTHNAKTEATNKNPIKPEKELLDVELKLQKYLIFSPLHFTDKWDSIKKGYVDIQTNKSVLDTYELIAFMTSLEGSLSVLITSDQAINRLPTSPQDYQAQAKNLLSQNLDLSLSQIEYFQSQIGEKHVKSLEIHKQYQTAKMGK